MTEKWYVDRALKKWRFLPFLTLWGILISCNYITFEEKLFPYFQTVLEIWTLVLYFTFIDPQKIPRVILKMVTLDKSRPWAFFNGACKVRESVVVLGSIVYLSESHYFRVKANCGRGTNNLGEFKSLFLFTSICTYKEEQLFTSERRLLTNYNLEEWHSPCHQQLLVSSSEDVEEFKGSILAH